MIKNTVIRVPIEYIEEVERMIKKIKEKFDVTLSKTQAGKIIAMKSKTTIYNLTESELIKIMSE